MSLLCLLIVPEFKQGDPCPTGYLERQEWARIQLRAGRRQKRCGKCGAWRFAQEICCGDKQA